MLEDEGWEDRIRQLAAARQNGQQPPDDGRIFITRRGNADTIEPVQFAWKDWIELGVGNVLVGAGGVGKGLLAARLIAEWTQGNLPGEFEGEPINVLVIAHEDRQHNTWDPRILAAGGDLSRVHYLTYAEDVVREKRIPFEFNRHCARLERLMLEQDLRGAFFDQVFDHFAPDANGMLPQDTRQQLRLVGEMLGDINRFGIYSAHPNKGHGKSLRDLVGGSHQLVEVARCGLFVGYHPDEDGVRVVVRDKGNHSGPQTGGIRFKVQGDLVINPKTGQPVPAGRIDGLAHEEERLSLRDLSVDPATNRGPSKKQQALTVILELVADGGWHPRAKAEQLCEAAGYTGGTFKEAFSEADSKGLIETEQDEHKRGRPVIYRRKEK
jgi:hypothetical protein